MTDIESQTTHIRRVRRKKSAQCRPREKYHAQSPTPTPTPTPSMSSAIRRKERKEEKKKASYVVFSSKRLHSSQTQHCFKGIAHLPTAALSGCLGRRRHGLTPHRTPKVQTQPAENRLMAEYGKCGKAREKKGEEKCEFFGGSRKGEGALHASKWSIATKKNGGLNAPMLQRRWCRVDHSTGRKEWVQKKSESARQNEITIK